MRAEQYVIGNERKRRDGRGKCEEFMADREEMRGAFDG